MSHAVGMSSICLTWVKRPRYYSGLFSWGHLLYGEEEGCSGFFYSYDMEGIIPAEIEGCLAYTKDKDCAIYHERPVSCRNFPVINPEAEFHDFCSQGKQFSHFYIMVYGSFFLSLPGQTLPRQ